MVSKSFFFSLIHGGYVFSKVLHKSNTLGRVLIFSYRLVYVMDTFLRQKYPYLVLIEYKYASDTPVYTWVRIQIIIIFLFFNIWVLLSMTCI